MMKKITQFKRWLFLIGALLVILGVFLPWGCYRGFFASCFAGINFHLINLTDDQSDAIISMVTGSIGGILIISAIDSIYLWRWEFMSIYIVSVVSYILISKEMAYDNGGLFIIFLSSISLWSVFRLAHLTQKADLVVTVSSSALVLTLIYYLIRTVFYQTLGIDIQLGMPIALVGSALMFLTRNNFNSPATS